MEKIYSEFAGQEEWLELLDEFVSNLPQRIDSIQAAVVSEDTHELKRLVHQLRGACGSYGFHAVTPLASELEDALNRNTNMVQSKNLIDHFTGVLLSLTATA